MRRTMLDLIRAGNRVITQAHLALRPGVASEPRFKQLRRDLNALSLILERAQNELLDELEVE